MKNNLTTILISCCMVLIGFSTNILSAQQCFPPAAGATVFGTADVNAGASHNFTAVPVGSVIQLITNSPDDVFSISMCGTNPDGWASGEHDSSTHILDANTDEAGGANYLLNIEDGCTNGAGPQFFGPDNGSWATTAVGGGTFYLYLTEWLGNDNCDVASGQTYNIDIDIATAGPCSLGTLTTATTQSVCPSQPFEIAFDSTPVGDGGVTLTWDNTNTGGTGGTATIPFSWDGYGDFPISLNSSLNGALTTPFAGTWEFTVEALDAAGNICDQSSVITVTFLDASDATCSDCSLVDAGGLATPTSQSLCPNTFAIDLDGTQSSIGGYHLEFDNANSGGTGGTESGIFLTLAETDLPFTYDSDLNGILSGQTTPLPPLAGTWELTVFALNGNGERCDSTVATTVNFVSVDIILSASSTGETCQDGSGTASVVATGGSTYTYLWSNGMLTDAISGLSQGMYTVVVEDSASGCNAVASVEVTNDTTTTALTLTISETSDNCGASDGTATVDAVDGGSGNYSYEWSNGMTDEAISGLAAGLYNITVTDMVTGCSGSSEITVTSAGGATVELGSVTDVNCNAGTDGAITIMLSGGVAPYTFVWSNGETTQDISDLTAGVYTCTVTDANCPSVFIATVGSPEMALSVTGATTDITCNGESDGMIMTTVSGGTDPYTFAWSNGAITVNLTDLASGDYTVTITDDNGCEIVSDPLTIAEPSLITVTVDGVTDATGADDGTIMISVDGGTAPYTYAWSNGGTTEDLTDLAPEDYTGTITDANGCTIDAAVTVGGFFLDVNDINGVSSFSLSPNPTTGDVRIAMSLDNQYDVALEVFDIAGRSILSDRRSNSIDVVFNLDLNSYPNGIYFARFIVDGQTFTERIIKSN